ncbi:hypothetical protein OG730_43780 (plasmid) [Streptomyces sp. NBC_01298]|uniref:hypothetical protein n=1 Tax=Streptomyces sp. NBC_01298 TaxID=2903817 RepID=UPI002E1315F5|nr:hypothetical protein OG730_43780 [Streptomyces sp. NBC_01298]
MVVEAGTQEDRVTGRLWVVRLDPYGRPSAGTVRLTCSRPACAEQRLPSATEGRKAAVGHLNTHLAQIRAGGGPRPSAWCACRTTDCAWHTPDPTTLPGRKPAARPPCGGPTVLTVCADRAGRLWRIAEMCARCAAATPGCRVLDTAAPPPSPIPDTAGTRHTAGGEQAASGPAGTAAFFSDHAASSAGEAAPDSGPASVPSARTATSPTAPRRAKRWGKIAQRIVPYDLQPDVLRLELIELGDLFRTYQNNPEPDLARLADLHDRKARAFSSWADVTGETALRHEAKRAAGAAQATRDMHANRLGLPAGDADGPVVERLLTRNHAVHARTVLDYVRDHAPHAEPDVHLLVLLLTLRAARDGTGNITGQDITGWLPSGAEQALEQLVAAGWLRLPGSAAEALASRPEDFTTFTVPGLLPEQPRPFSFGKTTRAKISGWAQKAVGDRKLRKKKLGAATRLLALYTAAHTQGDGHLGHPDDDGLALEQVAAFCAMTSEEVAEHAVLLVEADWLTQASAGAGRLRGQLTERVLPLGGLL